MRVGMCPIPNFTFRGWNSDNIYKWGLWNGLSWVNDPSFYFRDGPNPSHPHARKTLLLYWTGRVHPPPRAFLFLCAWVNFPPTQARTCLTGTNWYACISSTSSWRANAHYFFNYSTMRTSTMYTLTSINAHAQTIPYEYLQGLANPSSRLTKSP
jgi:hypothetical protein